MIPLAGDLEARESEVFHFQPEQEGPLPGNREEGLKGCEMEESSTSRRPGHPQGPCGS
jgi:hypothetical protein